MSKKVDSGKADQSKADNTEGGTSAEADKRLQEVMEEKQEVLLNYQAVQQQVNALKEKLKVEFICYILGQKKQYWRAKVHL